MLRTCFPSSARYSAQALPCIRWRMLSTLAALARRAVAAGMPSPSATCLRVRRSRRASARLSGGEGLLAAEMSLLFGPRFPKMYPPADFQNPVKGRVLCLIFAGTTRATNADLLRTGLTQLAARAA
jgi:hypothetical protein